MLKQFKKDLEGCGTFLSNKVDVSDSCGRDGYCSTCKSKIKAKIEILKEMKEFLGREISFAKSLKVPLFRETTKIFNEINTCLKLAEEKGI